MTYLAHSANRGGREEPVVEHLSSVATTAESFARVFGAGDEARAAGLLHDLGKFGTRFQQRLADPTHVKGVDHWSFGAEFAWIQYGLRNPLLPAALDCVIRGHHIGLEQATADGAACRVAATPRLAELASQLGESSPHAILERFAQTGLMVPRLQQSIYQAAAPSAVATMLDVRMLFSTLVDADYLETEAHFNGTALELRRYRQPSPDFRPGQALAVLSEYVDRVSAVTHAAADVLAAREVLRGDCLAAAALPRGVYTLTAPTGAGKTLAMLAFALAHATTHPELRRVVTVIPFLTIIEQTAAIYRRVLAPTFGNEYVIEDHSQSGNRADMGPQENSHAAGDGVAARERRRMLAENWDAPLVVTTSVQMLESLFANRPRACRKLHRLAGSVLLFDEVQTLPPALAVATLAAVARLVERYGCTAVFATATQPAFEHLHPEVQKHCEPGWRPTEIVHRRDELFATSARRTRVEWRLDVPTAWSTLATELADHPQVLCVVNLKRHARGLVEHLERELRERNVSFDGLLHLSTNLCPAHRERVLAETRHRLQAGQPCWLIATQCIEAGVDVDFPRAYRALGPLEAVAQVAGRCNRSGNQKEPQTVVVFIPEMGPDETTLYPPGYSEASLHARDFVRQWQRKHGRADDLIHNPEAIADCFRQFYDLSGSARMPKSLADALQARDFARVKELYRLIDSDTVRVLVPFDAVTYAELRSQADPFVPLEAARAWFARAAPLAVNIYRPGRDADTSALLPVSVGASGAGADEADWFILTQPHLYDCARLGLCGIGDSWVV